MKSATLTVQLGNGRERAISRMVQTANYYNSRILVAYGDVTFNAKSLMGVIALFPEDGTPVTISADGSDEETAIEGMYKFLVPNS